MLGGTWVRLEDHMTLNMEPISNIDTISPQKKLKDSAIMQISLATEIETTVTHTYMTIPVAGLVVAGVALWALQHIALEIMVSFL